MKPDIAARWTAALRSGEYPQGTGALNEDGKFCCLGVLSELAVADGVVERQAVSLMGPAMHSYAVAGSEEVNTGFPPMEVREWAGMFSRTGDFRGDSRAPLTSINDSGTPFAEIADIIDANVEVL